MILFETNANTIDSEKIISVVFVFVFAIQFDNGIFWFLA